MDLFTTVIVPVIATYFCTILAYLFRYFIIVRLGHSIIEKVLICFPQRRNISGSWETQFRKKGESYTEIAKISQLCGRVWGTILSCETPIRKYKMMGSIKEGVLVASYQISEPKEILDIGSFTLRLSSNGRELEGCGAWTDDDKTVPQKYDYKWIKLSSRGTNSIRVQKSLIHRKGVFANKPYAPQTEIAYFHGCEIDHSTRHSLLLEGRNIEGMGPLRFLNHSCDPNCCFEGRMLVSKRAINVNNELTIDYLSLESPNHLSHPFKCRCGAQGCRKSIG